MHLIGCGPSELERFAAVMDMPPPSNRHSLASYSDSIVDAVEKVAHKSVKTAAAELRTSVLGREADDDSSLANVSVSFDGSWSTRGFASKYGFTSVISISTKKVLDWYTASRLCNQCSILERSKDEESEEWVTRKQAHHEVFFRNHAGSAKSMEADGAEML